MQQCFRCSFLAQIFFSIVLTVSFALWSGGVAYDTGGIISVNSRGSYDNLIFWLAMSANEACDPTRSCHEQRNIIGIDFFASTVSTKSDLCSWSKLNLKSTIFP